QSFLLGVGNSEQQAEVLLMPGRWRWQVMSGGLGGGQGGRWCVVWWLVVNGGTDGLVLPGVLDLDEATGWPGGRGAMLCFPLTLPREGELRMRETMNGGGGGAAPPGQWLASTETGAAFSAKMGDGQRLPWWLAVWSQWCEDGV
ncbi:hypothetical protein Dimus_024257, partial [Dionaea muscipula]